MFIPARRPRVRLYVALVDGCEFHLPLDHHLGLLESLFDVAHHVSQVGTNVCVRHRLAKVIAAVVGVNDLGIGAHRLIDFEDGLQLLVLDLDQVGRFLRQVQARRRDRRDRVPPVDHFCRWP